MPRNVFLSWITRPFGKERNRKKKELASDGRRGYREVVVREKKVEGDKAKKTKRFEKRDSTVVQTHEVLSLADLHVSVLNYPIPPDGRYSVFSSKFQVDV